MIQTLNAHIVEIHFTTPYCSHIGRVSLSSQMIFPFSMKIYIKKKITDLAVSFFEYPF